MRDAKLKRLKLGLRQRDVADHLGVSQAQIGHFEMGRCHLSAARLLLLAQLLRTTPQALLVETVRPEIIPRVRTPRKSAASKSTRKSM